MTIILISLFSFSEPRSISLPKRRYDHVLSIKKDDGFSDLTLRFCCCLNVQCEMYFSHFSLSSSVFQIYSPNELVFVAVASL